MASIKKCSNGTYQATIYIGRDENNKQLFKYVTKPTQEECRTAARKVEQELEILDKAIQFKLEVR